MDLRPDGATGTSGQDLARRLARTAVDEGEPFADLSRACPDASSAWRGLGPVLRTVSGATNLRAGPLSEVRALSRASALGEPARVFSPTVLTTRPPSSWFAHFRAPGLKGHHDAPQTLAGGPACHRATRRQAANRGAILFVSYTLDCISCCYDVNGLSQNCRITVMEARFDGGSLSVRSAL